MHSKKFSTMLLVLLMLCSLTLFVGCGKESETDNDKDPDIVDREDEDDEIEDNSDNQDIAQDDTKKEENKVILLKRNGVEWKENSKINSQRGAKSYTVVWGDTLSLIARTWNCNTYTLARYNGIKNIDLIEVGQVIYNYTYQG